MNIESLRLKRALRTALLVLLLGVAGMGKGYAVIIGDLNYYLDNNTLTAGVWGHKDGINATGQLIIPSSVTFTDFDVTRTYTVTWIANGAFARCSGLTGNLTIPNSITEIGSGAFRDCSGFTGNLIISNSVTTIEQETFKRCIGIEAVSIPNSVTIIGSDAFLGCTNLTSVTISNSVTIIEGRTQESGGCFAECANLISVTFGNSLNTIGSGAFYRCSSLTSVTIPNSVTRIEYEVFKECSSLTSITIPNSVTTIQSGAFMGCSSLPSITIPNSVTTIGSGAFDNCTSLTSITIPKSVTTIGSGEGEDSFVYGCTSLTNIHVEVGNPNYASIDGVLFNSSKDKILNYPQGRIGGYVIPTSVISIGKNAFSGCDNLTSITIPNSVTSIDGSAFFMCTGLTAVTIPNSVTVIGGTAFWGCTGLTSIIIPDSVTTIKGGGDLGGCFAFCTNLSSVTIGNSLNVIGNGCFTRCTNLNSITIGNSVATIGGGAFFGCTSLTSIIIPNSVTIINDRAFTDCTSLTSITIPNSVTTIEYGAFMDCTSLASVTIGSSVTSIRDEVFTGCTSLREINFNAKNCVNSDWTGCTGVTTIMVGDSVEVIRENMFSGFENLTTLTIGNSVRSIGGMAFANNPRLNMVYYNVEKDLEASTDVFDNCPNLTTIHIGADVQEIGSNIFKGCNTVHFVVALGPTPAILDAGAFSDIVDNSILMVSCGKRVTYYSVWNMFPFNNIIEDCDTYGINVGIVGNGGTITPSVTEAQMGQEMQITITPNPGMVLVSIKVVNANDPTQIIPISPNGKAASTYSFTMPPFEVVVMATFATANTAVEENITVSIPASVYPNPTTGFVKVEAENIKHITISNTLGQQIFNGKASGNEFEYDFSGQKAGIYLVRIETASGVAVKKVSVTR